MKFVKNKKLDQRLNELNLPIDTQAELKSFITAQLKLLTYAHVDIPFAFQIAELLNPGEGEILSVKGGHDSLKHLFLERIAHHEGALRTESAIEKLLFKNGVIEGVELASQEGTILSRYVIWNTDLKKLGNYLPNTFRYRSLRKSIQKISPSALWFSCSFEVPSKFIPQPMGDNIIFISKPDEALEGTNFLYIQIKKRQEQKTEISVSYLLPCQWLEKSPGEFAPLYEKIKNSLHFLMPFSENDLKLTFPLEKRPEESETLFPLGDNDFEILKQSAQNHPVYSLKPSSFKDLFPLTYKTPTPNFFLTSPEILGSMGYEGRFMLGLKVTDIIWQDVEKEKRRAMKLEKRIA